MSGSGRTGWRRAVALALAGAVWGAVAVVLVLAVFAYDLPDVNRAFRPTRAPSVVVLAADGTELARLGEIWGRPIPLHEMAPELALAVVATEDRRFFQHFGLDLAGLARAALANLRAGRAVQGGSTITQQLAKNLFLTPERTLKRKIQEAMLAFWLERRFDKEEILTVYLNRVYLGAGAYGVDAAAKRYFDAGASELSLYQSALLAGLLKAPSRFNPLASPERAHARAIQVLENMAALGFVTSDEVRALAQSERPVRARAPAPGAAAKPAARYLAEWVIEQLSDFVAVGDRDLRVETTVDARLQGAAEAAVARAFKEKIPGGPEQAALVALSPSGAVKALVGGRDFGQSQFNRATQARRQPGSVFKPVVYLAALEAGLSPAARFVDGPFSIAGYSPRNYEGTYAGEVGLPEAVARSINTVAVQVAVSAGLGRVVEMARRLGLGEEFEAEASLALGTAEVTLLDLAQAYAVLANGGRRAWPYAIERITDTEGRVIWRRQGEGAERLADEAQVRTLVRWLAGAIEHGTGRQAKLDREAAGKTGTTQNFRDAWFLGFTADLVAGVWMGNDDASAMKNVTGGGAPARLWRDFMLEAHKGLPPRALF
ncbi:MAG: PBP1A family penicillin-binding protein [Rhodospirillales bacterium]|nr:PBP1A family penicillin-binding protein [Rhodospirillales bacterium]MSP80057.1 PBP1A family penicillin-binding protein [Rhodospirillales bacterium]